MYRQVAVLAAVVAVLVSIGCTDPGPELEVTYYYLPG